MRQFIDVTGKTEDEAISNASIEVAFLQIQICTGLEFVERV